MSERWRKKPVVVEAMQFDGTEAGAEAVRDWMQSDVMECRSDGGRLFLDIVTLEGCMTADEGDWLIRGVQGEFYPCKPDIFEATYEPAARKPPTPAGAVPVDVTESMFTLSNGLRAYAFLSARHDLPLGDYYLLPRTEGTEPEPVTCEKCGAVAYSMKDGQPIPRGPERHVCNDCERAPEGEGQTHVERLLAGWEKSVGQHSNWYATRLRAAIEADRRAPANDDESVRCSCEWAHPVDGSIDSAWPAELATNCVVHAGESRAPAVTEGWERRWAVVNRVIGCDEASYYTHETRRAAEVEASRINLPVEPILVRRADSEEMGLESRWLCLDNDGFPIGGFLTEPGRGLTKVYVEVGPPTEPPA